MLDQTGAAEQATRRIIVAITGASGAVYGVRLLEALGHIGGVETHLIVSGAGALNLKVELAMGRAAVESLADVVLKERRRLVLLVRESPLHAGHLRNMLTVTELGGIVFPPAPAFYAKPCSLDEMIRQTVARIVSLFGIVTPELRIWAGMRGDDGVD